MGLVRQVHNVPFQKATEDRGTSRPVEGLGHMGVFLADRGGIGVVPVRSSAEDRQVD